MNVNDLIEQLIDARDRVGGDTEVVLDVMDGDTNKNVRVKEVEHEPDRIVLISHDDAPWAWMDGPYEREALRASLRGMEGTFTVDDVHRRLHQDPHGPDPDRTGDGV